MRKRSYSTVDGNQAVADLVYRLNEVIAIYPITPASPMGEWADQWSVKGVPNIWGAVPRVVEMQSEAGAAGAVHGALQAGTLTTTFTASQGLLLMLPNMYKIAGELTPTVFHVASRSLAIQALSIFGDHSDVMAARSTGFAMLASSSVQEAADLALISHTATLEARVPFLHFFDGFRTSHEVAKIERLSDYDLRAMINPEKIQAHRARALSPDHPFIRGTSQNPDVYFQAREAVNPYYRACPDIVQQAMDQFAEQIGRSYHLFDYFGAPDADRVVVLMGSGCEAAQETVEYLMAQDEKVGVLKVRLYRPFSVEHFIARLPRTVKAIAVLDRTKEPGSTGEPLYLDVVAAMNEAITSKKPPFSSMPRVIGGRYGLSSKEFTPAMIKRVFEELTRAHPKNHFTIGITDDVTHTSLDYDSSFSTKDPDATRAIFFGLGSDGTVGANRNSIKIIGERTDDYVQAYFVYDSKKAGSMTVSHLRFGPRPIHSTYLIRQAHFVGCHQFSFLERYNVLKSAEPGATFLLNSPHGPEEVWDYLPRTIQEEILQKKMRFFVIDAYRIAQESGLGVRINTMMQVCFFAIIRVLERDEAISAIKDLIQKTYGKHGKEVVQKNCDAVDATLAHLHEARVPRQATSSFDILQPVSSQAPEFVQQVTARLIAGEGDDLPVSALPVDGTFPSGTAKWEKRGIALEIPVWDEDLCIQCGKCILVCPHSVIRSTLCESKSLTGAPSTFKVTEARSLDFKGQQFTLQIAPEDCTGCTLCVQVCPAKSKSEVRHKAINMESLAPIRDRERAHWDFFLKLPQANRQALNFGQVKDVQYLEPLFEFSGACAGCGETPYIKLMTQLFGDRALIANATGCSSIFGGNLPTTPWTANREGRGPAWSNSLFEDNAEFGFGMRLALDKQADYACTLIKQHSTDIDKELLNGLLSTDQSTEKGIAEQREQVQILKKKLLKNTSPWARDLLAVSDTLVKKSVWIVGGDGWAYDIGFGGLDHVLAMGENVNILVLDTEGYSNTGGQMSKATPLGAVAKFATGGKTTPKKDLALMAMSYGNTYVANVAMGAGDTHTVKAFLEAEAYQGPSLIIAYSHCIAHGYHMAHGLEQQKAAAQSGAWPLFRYHPDLARQGKNPLQLDSKKPSIPLKKYLYNETRYTMLAHSQPKKAEELLELAQAELSRRWHFYYHLANLSKEEKSKGGPDG